MMSHSNHWQKGRGKLGIFKPLIGFWVCKTETERGQLNCKRTFTPVLNNKYIQLTAIWQFATSSYEEHCLFGTNHEKQVAFWSFTNDGKQSNGLIADVTDIHPQAVGFAAKMPSGFARQFYWPDEQGGFFWAVESRTKKGWNRFAEHHYVSTV